MKIFFISFLLCLCTVEVCLCDEKQNAINFSDGSSYVGQLVEGAPQGNGSILFSDGSKYTGEFKNGQLDGQGTMIFPDGAEYIGQFKDGNFDGQGAITFPDGSRYEGGFKGDKYHGEGVWFSPSGIRYEGQIKENKFDGEGTLSLPDGSKYVGQFKEDKPYGKGSWILYHSDQNSPEPNQLIEEGKDIAPDAHSPYALSIPSSGLAFCIQVGAFLSSQNAENLAALLREKGYDAHMVSLPDNTNRDWYTVRIGNYPMLGEAQEKATLFTEKEKMTATVRPVDSL